MKNRLLAIAGLGIGIAALLPVQASAAGVTTDVYKIISDLPPAPSLAVPSDGPSTLQAGANPSAGSYAQFNYPNATEDIKTATTAFAPGLLGNPEAVPKCPEVALEAPNYGATCPPGSAIGTSRLDAAVSGTNTPFLASSGIVYNAEPLGNEPGRLGVVTNTILGTLVSSIPFEITPRGNGDYGLTGTLTDIPRLPPPPVDLQGYALSFLINADSRYVRNPTSCVAATSVGTSQGYDDPTINSSPPYTFTPTGCDQLGFTPSVSVSMGSTGENKTQQYPPLDVKITNQNGNADIKGNTIQLPEELNTNNTNYKLCTQAQADADACPANSQFGTTSARSPFLAQELSGPVYLIQQSASSLPGLLLDLRGRAHVKIQTSTVLVNNKQIKSVVTNAPQLPVSELNVHLNGGKTTGVFQNRSDLCFQGTSTSKFKDLKTPSTFEGWNGKTTAATVDTPVLGCGPGVSTKMSRAQTSKPKLLINSQRHPDAQNFKQLQITLPKGTSLVKRKFRKIVAVAGSTKLNRSQLRYVNSRNLIVNNLGTKGAGGVVVSLKNGAFKISKSKQRSLNKGRKLTFKTKVLDTPVAGAAVSTTASTKVRGKRRAAGTRARPIRFTG